MSESARYKVRNRIKELLPRLRHTLPCPLSPEIVYHHAFDMATLGAGLKQAPATVAELNFGKAVRVFTNVKFTLEDPWSRLKPGKVEDPVFWMTFDEAKVVPIDSHAAFFLDDAVRKNSDLLEWLVQATGLDAQIERYLYNIAQLTQDIQSISALGRAFPELQQAIPSAFTDFDEAIRLAGPKPPVANRRKVVSQFGEDGIRAFTDAVSKAIMLPAGKHLTAWVDGVGPEEGG